MFGKCNSQTFLSIFLYKIMRILNILLSFDKIGCTSEEKQTSLFCFSLGLHYLCSSYNKSEIQQKLFPMSYLFAIIVLAALFKAFNS